MIPPEQMKELRGTYAQIAALLNEWPSEVSAKLLVDILAQLVARNGYTEKQFRDDLATLTRSHRERGELERAVN